MRCVFARATSDGSESAIRSFSESYKFDIEHLGFPSKPEVG